MNVRGLPGHGPWRILDECQAPTHNTHWAAKKHGAKRPTCICPGADQLRRKTWGKPYLTKQEREALPPEHPVLPECTAQTHNTHRGARSSLPGVRCICPHSEKLREQRRQDVNRYASNRREKGPSSLTAVVERTEVPPPRGLCSRPANIAIADRGFNYAKTAQGEADRYAAKELCDFCPARAACERYIRSVESPPGSWGGVWAGMDPWEREGKRIVLTAKGSRVEKVRP